MININIPNNNINERKYILDVIFNDFLGLEYSLNFNSKDYEIVLANKKRLIIKDCFFNKHLKNLEYLKIENIPKSIKELDIFSACFFMLTRWEEYVNKNRDIHNRFPATESLAYKDGFLNRPIVNEHIEELKSKLLNLDGSLIFKKRKFELFLTHDVDEIQMWKSWKQVFRVMIGDIIKRKSISLACERMAEYFLIKRNKIKDPFDTFDWLMDKSEAIGVQSRFYFMSGGVTKYDNNYDIYTQKRLIKHIKNRGHIIGIHSSYNAYNDIIQLKKEKDILESVADQKIIEGRGHYLRFEVPKTWQIWEDNGLEVDSTCGYADKEGFRCGTGDEFSVFNVLTRKKLNLKERPLLYMDETGFYYQGLNEKDALKNIIALKKEYLNSYTLLWHQSFNKQDMYLKIIKKLRNKKNE